MIWVYGYCFFMGACFGSFVYAATWRYVRKWNFITGHSCCPYCHHALAWNDLIPIVSWLWLRGKCRYCGESIAMRYWLFELGGGVIALLCCYHYGITSESFWVFVMILILIGIAIVDQATMMIPNVLQLLLLIPIAVLTLIHPEMAIMKRVLGAISISGFMALLNWWVKDSFGGGDMKLMLLCGWLLGWQRILLAMTIAIWSAGIYAVYLLITGRAQRTSHIAFAPYLCVGIIFAQWIHPLIMSVLHTL